MAVLLEIGLERAWLECELAGRVLVARRRWTVMVRLLVSLLVWHLTRRLSSRVPMQDLTALRLCVLRNLLLRHLLGLVNCVLLMVLLGLRLLGLVHLMWLLLVLLRLLLLVLLLLLRAP